MSRMFKIISIILVVFVLFSTTACTTNNGGQTTTSAVTTASGTTTAETTTAETTTANPYAKKLELTWFGNGTDKVEDDNWVEKKLEGIFNVDIKLLHADAQSDDQMNLLLSSGEMTDVFLPYNYGSAEHMYDQGWTRSIPRDMTEKYAPNYAKMLDANQGWLYYKVKGKDNEYLNLPGVSESLDGIDYVSYYRLDWLKKLGISPKGTLQQLDDRIWWTTEAFTVDEMENIFKSFVNDDPDGNGQKDTFAMSGNNDGFSYAFAPFGGMFGFADARNLLEDGKIQWWNTSKGFKDFLKLMAKFYKEGLIDSEITINDLTKFWEKILAGKVGWWNVGYDYLVPTSTDRPPYGVLARDPKAEILVTPSEIGPTGKSGSQFYLDASNVMLKWYGNYVGKQVDDEKLIRILQMMDYINFDKEARVWTFFGEEGVDFTWSGEPYNSQVIPKEQTPEYKAKKGYGGVYRSTIVWLKDWLKLYEPATMTPVAAWCRDPEKGGKLAIYNYKYDVFGDTKSAEMHQNYDADLSATYLTFMLKCITGDLDIDKEWDGYVKKMYDSGLTQILAEDDKAPLISEFRKGIVKY